MYIYIYVHIKCRIRETIFVWMYMPTHTHTYIHTYIHRNRRHWPSQACQHAHTHTYIHIQESPSLAFASLPAGNAEVADFSLEEVDRLIAEGMTEATPPDDVPVPDELLPHAKVLEMRDAKKPTVVSKEKDPVTGVTMVCIYI